MVGDMPKHSAPLGLKQFKDFGFVCAQRLQHLRRWRQLGFEEDRVAVDLDVDAIGSRGLQSLGHAHIRPVHLEALVTATLDWEVRFASAPSSSWSNFKGLAQTVEQPPTLPSSPSAELSVVSVLSVLSAYPEGTLDGPLFSAETSVGGGNTPWPGSVLSCSDDLKILK